MERPPANGGASLHIGDEASVMNRNTATTPLASSNGDVVKVDNKFQDAISAWRSMFVAIETGLADENTSHRPYEACP